MCALVYLYSRRIAPLLPCNCNCSCLNLPGLFCESTATTGPAPEKPFCFLCNVRIQPVQQVISFVSANNHHLGFEFLSPSCVRPSSEEMHREPVPPLQPHADLSHMLCYTNISSVWKPLLRSFVFPNEVTLDV